MNLDGIKRAVAADAPGFAKWLFPDGKCAGQRCHVGNVAGEPGRSLVVDLDGGYRDWATGESGDCIALVMAARNVDFAGAVRLMADHYSLAVESSTNTKSSQPERQRADQKQHAEPKKKRALAMPIMEVGTADDLRRLSQLRNLSIDALTLATKRGLLWFFDSKDGRAWLITDSARRNAQARRLDREPWSWNEKKAWTLGGSTASWPIGLPESEPFKNIAVCEGAPDFLAAFHHALATEKDDSVAPVCLTGASIRIPDECISAFTGKNVRIFIHDDEAGRAAAERWARQLSAVAAHVDGFTFDGLVRTDGSPVKDLCDLASIDVDSWEMQRDAAENCMAFVVGRDE